MTLHCFQDSLPCQKNISVKSSMNAQNSVSHFQYPRSNPTFHQKYVRPYKQSLFTFKFGHRVPHLHKFIVQNQESNSAIRHSFTSKVYVSCKNIMRRGCYICWEYHTEGDSTNVIVFTTSRLKLQVLLSCRFYIFFLIFMFVFFRVTCNSPRDYPINSNYQSMILNFQMVVMHTSIISFKEQTKEISPLFPQGFSLSVACSSLVATPPPF